MVDLDAFLLVDWMPDSFDVGERLVFLSCRFAKGLLLLFRKQLEYHGPLIHDVHGFLEIVDHIHGFTVRDGRKNLRW